MTEKEPKITHHPLNAGKKYCSLVEVNGKLKTGWGDSPESATDAAISILSNQKKK